MVRIVSAPPNGDDFHSAAEFAFENKRKSKRKNTLQRKCNVKFCVAFALRLCYDLCRLREKIYERNKKH